MLPLLWYTPEQRPSAGMRAVQKWRTPCKESVAGLTPREKPKKRAVSIAMCASILRRPAPTSCLPRYRSVAAAGDAFLLTEAAATLPALPALFGPGKAGKNGQGGGCSC